MTINNTINLKNIIFILLAIVFGSCSSLKIMKSENTSILALTATTSYLGGTGNGMIITLKNIETGEKYEAKKLSHFSSYCIVQNLKPGKYRVEKIVLDTGGNKFSNWSESVQQYFGEIEIEGNQKYYLGTFKGKVKIKFKNAISIQLENQIVPEKLKAVLKEQGTGWAEEEFKLIETVNREELIIY
ncbi:MAG: hypothetical protein WBP33_10045 [Saprospiraceae bacterium]